MARSVLRLPGFPTSKPNDRFQEERRLPEEPSVDARPASFLTEQLEIINHEGRRIAAYWDAPVMTRGFSGLIVILPAYGETKESNLLVSSYFVANGFHGIRFDWTDHVGESDGETFTSMLSKMQGDIVSILDFLEQRFPAIPISILASSLSARALLKTAALDPRPSFLICFAPVVNLRHTLTAVYREDLVEGYSQGKRYGTLDILGLRIDADSFLKDALEKSFSDLSTALQDASQIRIPTLFLIAEKDSWIDPEAARSVFQVIPAGSKELFAIPAAGHRLAENPIAVREGLKIAVIFLNRHACGRELDEGDVVEPLPGEIRAREALEKARLRELYTCTKSDERRFWKEYLDSFQYIVNIHDYWNMLELIYDLLGGAWPGQKILDAGCGNGSYGLFLLSKLLYRLRQDPRYLCQRPVGYFGIDFVVDGLIEASRKIGQLQVKFRGKAGLNAMAGDFMQAQFLAADLEDAIPFPDNFFDQICCNLVISYLREPVGALKELYRVLRPGGKLVVSGLKPNADLSEIYRNFVSVAEDQAQVEEARKLLSNAGLIRIKEIRGLYHFYFERELKRLARDVGFIKNKTFRSFGNQANIVAGSKPN